MCQVGHWDPLGGVVLVVKCRQVLSARGDHTCDLDVKPNASVRSRDCASIESLGEMESGEVRAVLYLQVLAVSLFV